MKRIAMLVSVIGVIAMGLGVSSVRHGTATSDDIPVLQTQVAELDARVTALEGRTGASPVAGQDVRQWTGTGDQIIDIGVLAQGVYIVSVSYPSTTDTGIFDAYITGVETGWQEAWFAAERAPVDAERVFANNREDRYLLAVRARDSWVITLTLVE
jgi:hypothetical protein